MPRKLLPLHLIVLFVLSPMLLAMGGGGGAPVSDQIPRPQDNYGATLLDREGVAVRVDHLSCDGKTFFPLQRGAGTLMIPFGKIDRLSLAAEEGGQLPATITTDSGQTLEGTLSRGLLLTGVTEFGTYHVELGGLQEISFR